MRQILTLTLFLLLAAFNLSAPKLFGYRKEQFWTHFGGSKLEEASVVLIPFKDSTMAAFTQKRETTLKRIGFSRFLSLTGYLPASQIGVVSFGLKTPGRTWQQIETMITRSNLLSEFVLKQRNGALFISKAIHRGMRQIHFS